MREIYVRPTRIEDAAGVAAVQVQGWKTAYRGILPDELLDGLDEAESAERHRDRLLKPLRPGIQSFVLVRGEQVIAWAAMGPTRDEDLGEETHEVYAIYVLPSCIGEGHGRMLMEHCLSAARAAGRAQIALWVFRENERALRFYAAAGFVADGRAAEKPFRDTGALEVRLVRAL